MASERVEVGHPCCEYCILNSYAELFPPPPAPCKLFREAIASDNWQPLTRVVVILEGSVYREQVILLVVDLYLCCTILFHIIFHLVLVQWRGNIGALQKRIVRLWLAVSRPPDPGAARSLSESIAPK